MGVSELGGSVQNVFSVEDGFDESGVGLAGFFLTARFGLGVDDPGDVGVVVAGQVDELDPVGGRDEFGVVLSEVDHQEQLAGEELAVHLIGLEGEEATEAVQPLGV